MICMICSSAEREKVDKTHMVSRLLITGFVNHPLSIQTLTMILALEQLTIPALHLGRIDLRQIRIDQIAHRSGHKRPLVLVDHLPIERKHILSILCDLIACRLLAGQILHRRNIIDGMHLAKQAHSLLDEERETPEFRIVHRETHRHHHVADHIADGHRVHRAHIDRSAAARAQRLQHIGDFGHDALLHQMSAVAHVRHAELAQFDVQEATLVLPQVADAVDDACDGQHANKKNGMF